MDENENLEECIFLSAIDDARHYLYAEDDEEFAERKETDGQLENGTFQSAKGMSIDRLLSHRVEWIHELNSTPELEDENSTLGTMETPTTITNAQSVIANAKPIDAEGRQAEIGPIVVETHEAGEAVTVEASDAIAQVGPTMATVTQSHVGSASRSQAAKAELLRRRGSLTHFSKPIFVPDESKGIKVQVSEDQDPEVNPSGSGGFGGSSSAAGLAASQSNKTFGMKMASVVSKVKIRERKKKVKDGVVVFKGHPSWSIVLAIQFGLKHTSELLEVHPPKELTPADFEDELIFHFDAATDQRSVLDVNDHTKWDHHSPFVYRRIRELFGITDQAFLGSIVAESKVRELPTPGRSGALFYITEDEQYFIKTITGHEEDRLRSFLPEYYEHVVKNPETLLTRFVASFSMKTRRGRYIRMVAMSSIFRDGLYIDEKYDLKGSTKNRKATQAELEKENVTLKDLDFDRPVYLSKSERTRLFHQIRTDTEFLERQSIMDYSLLVGFSEVLPADEGVFEQRFACRGDPVPWWVGHQRDADDEAQDRKYRLSMGIIDILQTFTVKKRAEYCFRVTQQCGSGAVSVNPPARYRRRFIEFLEHKFLSIEDPSSRLSYKLEK
uniref:PIPK domain-containing protein n=1 Tax=Compsopogon caeruleus TaxID=31354 RepID=A0A7S1TDU5_9RHOD|mmetsp:Transcript_2673/g.4848  ORF Transcript_2673/g.4848 Transcript_2673/m.4848 type:complete len:612 (+) Transcript_2673:537-2372(+)|eukprot:CAMPEP_0184677724 /NCGR_PEP_ID=MMETSP0312-20130426/303_1 /TAXON_ID=31354 /ORGANISM="Compsopogon coeruleus, Strain SAG 36.94" /LENGTH=611 /DNA_ID=CAMNT_0027125755 /DNA_START=504 /DNA_END=2339 /DNA_ORIENTATION=-